MPALGRRTTKNVAMLVAPLVLAAACASTSGAYPAGGLDQPSVRADRSEGLPVKRQRELVDKLYFDACLAAGAPRPAAETLDELDARASAAETVVTDGPLRARLRANVIAVLTELRRRDERSAQR